MKRNFITLAILTMAALIVVILVALKDGSLEKSVADTLLIPTIADQINDVDRVEIVTAGNTTIATLVRAGEVWQLEQMGGYRADWSKLQALLAALAQATVIEAKTDNPDYYSRLGVEGVTAADAGGVLVRVFVGDQATGILIGNRSRGRKGQYVRLQDVAGSVLVDREFDIPGQALDWADTGIIDVNSTEVAEVEIIHPTAERILVMRISADQTDFDLAGFPSGREIKSSWAVNSLGSVFSLLNMETVRPEEDVDWTDAVKMRLLMFSGVEIIADLKEQGDEYLLRLRASHPGASVVQVDSGDWVAQQEIEKQAAEDVAKEVGKINQKVKGWAYGISKQKFEAMVKKPDDLLKPLETT